MPFVFFVVSPLFFAPFAFFAVKSTPPTPLRAGTQACPYNLFYVPFVVNILFLLLSYIQYANPIPQPVAAGERYVVT